MKITIDLPEDLVKQVKLKAAHDCRRLDDTMADVIREGQSVYGSGVGLRARIVRSATTGLPVIMPATAPRSHLSSDDIAEILLNQETAWHDDAR